MDSWIDGDPGNWCSYRCATELRLRLSRCRLLTLYCLILIPISFFHCYWLFTVILPDYLSYKIDVVVHDYPQELPYISQPMNSSKIDPFRYKRDSQAIKQIPGLWDGYPVPNLVHYIMFGENKELTFVNYLSVLSVYKVQKPALIMLHCNNLPVGMWWERIWREIPLRIVHRDPPKFIHGQPLEHVYHQGDIAKMDVLRDYGGIYIDFDVIVINSLNPLRQFKVTLGKEKPPKLIAGIIISEPNALFIRLLHESYRKNYWGKKWDYNCAIVAYKLYQQRPDLVHIETTKLTTPDWTEKYLLYENEINWRELYVLHLMWHKRIDRSSPDSIKTLKGMIGEVFRMTYYGRPDMIT